MPAKKKTAAKKAAKKVAKAIVPAPPVIDDEKPASELADKRARDDEGQFKGDDPTTPKVDEAWKNGQSPDTADTGKAPDDKPVVPDAPPKVPEVSGKIKKREKILIAWAEKQGWPKDQVKRLLKVAKLVDDRLIGQYKTRYTRVAYTGSPQDGRAVQQARAACRARGLFLWNDELS